MGPRNMKLLCSAALMLNIFALCFIGSPALAQTFNYKTSEASSIVTGRQLMVSGLPVTLTTWCNEWPEMIAAPTTWGDDFKFKSLHAFLKFQVDNTHFIQQMDYTYQLTYQLRGYYTMADTTLFNTINDTLTISNASFMDPLNAYQDINLAKFSNYYKTVVVLTGIYAYTGGTPTPAVLTDTMRINYNIESSILSQRYDKISTTYGPYYGRTASLQITPEPHADKNYLTVYFNFASPDTSAIQYTPLNYELEWTFVDDYSTDVATGTRTPIASSDLSYDFNHNCTRVWLNDNRYRIPLAYPSGYIVYRMRTVRPDSILFKYPIYSDWSYATPDNGALSSLSSDAYYHVAAPYTGDSLNWQYTISFAEGGRYKHVASFYDGLLKNRESITRFNSTPDKLIVTKNIYDFEGRPAIKILPTPVSSYAFGFVHDVDLNSATSLPYKADDFDTAMHTCPVDARLSPLAATALASVYYSPSNPDQAGVQKYVPDAEGFPLVQTQFSAAINDRVEKQGGAGPRLQIADSNIISNFYVGAGQKELDRYFGISIGSHGYYNKIVTRDPNMQVSLSIKDYKGRQVMSALSGRGSKPDDHAIMPTDAPDSIYIKDDILNGAEQTKIGSTISYDHPFYHEAEGNVTFQYLYDYKPLKVCDSLFLNIGARYRYYVTNQCGDTVVADDSVICHSGLVTDSVSFVGNELNQVLYEGQYMLHKELTIEDDSIAAVIDQVVNSPLSCFLSAPYFIKKRVKEMDFPCAPEDDYCTAQRKRLKEELHPYKKYGMLNYFTGYAVSGTGNSVFTIMRVDTIINVNGSTEYHLRYRYQDTCTSYSLPDTITVGGITYNNLRTMSADSFFQIYLQSIWSDPSDPIAEALLPLHPEYCKLQRCYTDTFGARLSALPDIYVAQHLNLLYLDSIIAQDPFVPYLAGYGYPPDSLAYFAGGHIRLDSFLYPMVYCGCGDSVMSKECVNNIYGYEIQNRLLVNDYVKKAYFDQLIDMYITNRQHFLDLVINQGGDSCVHCADVRMFLTPTANFNNVVAAGGLTPPILLDSSWTGMAHAPWLMSAFGSLPGAGTAAMDSFILIMHDSATAICAAADSMLCFGRIDNIMDHLVNCANNDTPTLTVIRNTLDSFCTAHLVPYGGFTPEIVKYAILRSGATLTDFCNPYLIACDFAGPSFSTGQNCRSDSFYRSFNGFLNKTAVLNALRNVGTTYAHTLDITGSEMEQELYNVIGDDHTEIFATWSIIDTLYKLYAFKDHTLGVSDTIKIYFRGVGGCGNVFSLGDSISVFDVACINTLTTPPALGLIKQYSFVADAIWYQHTLGGITANICSMLGWGDTVRTMNVIDNTIAECVPCTQMRALYNEFNDSMLAINVYGPGHPLYGDMLRNFMNRKLGKVFGTSQYERFIESCALADSIAMPLYMGYAVLNFAHNDDADSFTVRYNTLDTNYTFDYLLRVKDATGSVSVFVDFDIVPFHLLWKYKLFIDTFTGAHLAKLTNFSAGAGGIVGYFYAPTGTVIPSEATLFGSGGTVSINSGGTYGIWVGNHYLAHDFYAVLSSPGTTPPWEISRDVYELQRYAYENPGQGIVYYNTFQSTINRDFFRTEKIDYLNYAYGFQGLPPYNVLDALQAVYLDAMIPSHSGRGPTYTNALNPNVVTNLYMADTIGGRLDILQQVMLGVAVDNPIGVGHMFFDTSVMDIYGDSSLLAIRCADNSYWYMYFGAGDTLWNMYIRMPAWVPPYTYPQYTLHGSFRTGMADSLVRHFTVNFQIPGDTLDVQAHGMATFVIGHNLKLRDVLLGNPFPSYPAMPLTDTFNNCERQLLQAAIAQGEDDYAHYIDSSRTALSALLLAQLRDSVSEQLLKGTIVQQFGVTLYYYDRAGNLISTVSPGGVRPLDTSVLSTVNDARNDRDYSSYSIYTQHKKASYYRYNSRNQSVMEYTWDGEQVDHYYDDAGRLFLTSDMKQAYEWVGDTGYVTYNRYDKQNRIVETGEAKVVGSVLWPMVYPVFDAQGITDYLWHCDRRSVIVTIYDTQATNLQNIAGLELQTNLRKRVAAVKYFDSLYMADSAYLNYTYATHYSYDIEGSVKTLTQDFPVLDSVKQRYKRIDYDYDLISGKVNMLSYNRSFADQYYQRYNYDDDNRLTKVETSSDGYIWKRDAEYTYYQHGPLARTELGDLRVQGIDYAYTIQGWLKAVNGDTANKALDMGRDGDLTINASDAVGFTLNYFTDDYKSISGTPVTSVEPQLKNLYNGNIARQTIAHANDSLRHEFPRYTRNYLYDQMNRLRNTAYGTIDATNTTITPTDEFRNNYTYDQDGNLLTLNRYAFTKPPALGPQLMDSFNYYYTPGGYDNKLRSLTDNAFDIGFEDVNYRTDSTIYTYMYDPVGNTTKDLIAGQDSIEWNVYHKVTRARNVNGITTLTYKYDGMGNRVAKTVTMDNGTTLEKKTDYYVRDAQGNILATYREAAKREPSTNTDIRAFSLAGHDVYGSARLGVKNYWPGQQGLTWDYYAGIYDTVRLWERKPWYSLEYQDVIKHDELMPYGNTLTAKLVSTHLAGQKQYEVADHLGNVTATVSDARESIGDSTLVDTFRILGYRPAIASMSDYYPFGMLMPSRHFEDNNGHTTTATLTVLAPQLNSVTIPMSSSMVSILGFASVPSGAPLSVQASSAGDGVQYTVHPVSGGLPQNIQINVSSGASAGWRAVLTQGAYSSSILLTATGYNTLSFTAPMSGTAVLQIIHPTIVPLPGPTIIINDIILDTFIFVPTLVVSQISSDNEYKYGFNGQMKDDEWAGTGKYLDFGARKYDTRIGHFPSPDSKQASFPYKSPYIAFSDNPIIFTDPSGKTDFYFNGKWKGTDGVNNGLIGVLRDKSVAKQVAAASKDGKAYADFGELKNGTSNTQLAVIHKDILSKSLHALYVANSKGANREYSYGMKKNSDGSYTTVYEHEGQEYDLTKKGRANGGSFSRDLDVTIHSHPTGLDRVGNTLGFSDASHPTSDNGFGAGDAPLFSHHDMNIIVGKNGQPTVTGGVVEDMRSSAINVYGSSTQQIMIFSQQEAEKILNDLQQRQQAADESKPKPQSDGQK